MATPFKMTAQQVKPKVLWIGTARWARERINKFKQFADVEYCDSQNREEFIKDLHGKYSNITNIGRSFELEQTGRFDEELASHFPPTLRSISHCGAGYDQVDVEPLIKRNIQLSNITDPVVGPTADTAVFLVLSTLRNFQQSHELLVNGAWAKGEKAAGAPFGHLPGYRTVGILGMGGIGRAIRDRLQPFGFKKVSYYNRSRLAPELEKDTEYLSMDELVAKSDIIVVAVPLNPKTHHLINDELIKKMKQGVILVNIARGAVIDEQALIPHLRTGRVGFLGTDVFENEPDVSPELLQLPNVTSLPHMGTHTVESQLEMEEFTLDNVESNIFTGKMKTIVPEMYNIDFKQEPLVRP